MYFINKTLGIGKIRGMVLGEGEKKEKPSKKLSTE